VRTVYEKDWLRLLAGTLDMCCPAVFVGTARVACSLKIPVNGGLRDALVIKDIEGAVAQSEAFNSASFVTSWVVLAIYSVSTSIS
jgi:hypothetical protein